MNQNYEPFFVTYFKLMKQIRLYGVIAHRELEKSEFNSVDRTIIKYTNDISVDNLKVGETTKVISKYREYIQLKTSSYIFIKLIHEKFNKTKFELGIIFKNKEQAIYKVKMNEFETIKNYDVICLNHMIWIGEHCVNKGRYITQRVLKYVN